MQVPAGDFLKRINYPSDLKQFKEAELEQVCNELRQYIIDVVSVNGGHFAASLGTVELTVALQYVLNTPYDQLVWDVGHQAYGHKILTGRRDNFHTNRVYKGISGFPKRSESIYDTFGVGTPLPLYRQHWVWLWHRNTKAKPTGSTLPLLAMAP
jgi:1-deoxy-D-xylulose-5-phosphate synthase